MVEMYCKDVVFHFNKKHLEDSTIPMWCLKSKGETFYVRHVDSMVPWSTKETIDNLSTKGSIKFKNCLLKIDDNNDATLSPMTLEDKERLKKADTDPYARIIIDDNFPKIRKYLETNNIQHSAIKKVTGGCTTLFYICDIMKKEDLALLSLVFTGSYRILQPNEEYYTWYSESIKKHHPADITESLFGKIKSIFSKSTEDEDNQYNLQDINEYDVMDDDDDE